MRYGKPGFLLLACVVSAGCCVAAPRAASPVRVVTPDGVRPAVQWSAEELSKPIAMRTLRRTDRASYAIIRLAGAEQPHVHQATDLAVVVMSGRVRMHLGEQTVEVGKGHVIEVPAGVVHWAENIASPASEAYVVFTPAYDGSDQHPVKQQDQ